MSTHTLEEPAVANETRDEGHGHEPPRYDDVNVPFIVLLGFFSAVITFVTIIFVQGLYYHWESEQINQKEYGKPVFAAEEIERQKNSLNGYLESKDEKRSIPIDRAMELVLAEQKEAQESHDDDHHGDHKADDATHEKEGEDKKEGTDQGADSTKVEGESNSNSNN